ncbi:MAG: hypothetical protein AAGN35_00835, partial [Bacteroidota bacterium]
PQMRHRRILLSINADHQRWIPQPKFPETDPPARRYLSSLESPEVDDSGIEWETAKASHT